MAREELVITARFVDKITKGLRTTRQTINQFGQTTKTVNKQFKNFNDKQKDAIKSITQTRKVVQSAKIAHKGFAGVMGMNLVQWRQYNAMGGQFKTIGGRAANTFRKMTHGLRGFRMEMLGVMFFGMGLQKFFTGLLKPAMKLTGLTELLSNVLAVLFLPIVLKIMDWLLPWIDRLMNLSDATKIFIGKLVLWGAAIGGILFLVGMFALGIGSLILVFAGLFSIFANVIKAVSTLFGGGALGGLASMFLVLIPSIDLMKVLWEKVIIVWEKIKELIAPVWDTVRDKIMAVVDELKGQFGPMWDELKEKVKGFTKDFKAELKEQGLDVGKWITDLKEAFGLGEGGVQGIWNSVKDKWDTDIKPMWDEFQESLDALIKLAPSFSDSLKVIANAIKLIGDAFKFVDDIMMAANKWLVTKVTREMTGAEWEDIHGDRQMGGFIPHTGLYRLHAGETVTPAGDTFTSSPTINVYGVGAEDIARQVSEMVTRDLASLARR